MMILAIDLGGRKSVWCMFDSRDGTHTFGAASSDRLAELIETHPCDLVVVEACSLSGHVVDLCRQRGREVIAADTTQDAWRWKNVKRKTDQDDALKLASLAAIGQLNPVHVPAPPIRQWRRLIHYRRSLIEQRTMCKNRIRRVLSEQREPVPSGAKAWTSDGLNLLRAKARPPEACALADMWRGQLEIDLNVYESLQKAIDKVVARLDTEARANPAVQLLQTIPGVGPRVAEAMVAQIDQAGRFRTRRQVAAYAGLTPRQYQSGETDHSGRISKRGNPLLRGLLSQAAWASLRCSVHFRLRYHQLAGPKQVRKKKAIVALMRRILVTAWAMLRDGTTYQSPRARAA